MSGEGPANGAQSWQTRPLSASWPRGPERAGLPCGRFAHRRGAALTTPTGGRWVPPETPVASRAPMSGEREGEIKFLLGKTKKLVKKPFLTPISHGCNMKLFPLEKSVLANPSQYFNTKSSISVWLSSVVV